MCPGSIPGLSVISRLSLLVVCFDAAKSIVLKSHINTSGEQGWHSGESACLPPMCPGSIPGRSVISRLSLLFLYSAPRGFSPVTLVFPSPQKPIFDFC